MRIDSLSHLPDPVLLRGLAALIARDCRTTAELLAYLAEVDARRLYLPAGYPSMFLYCVQELHLSEDSAYKRIQAARVARRFPAIFAALAEGRLHLAAVVLLAPHLSEDSAEELLVASTHRSKAEIEHLLAERFPRPGLLTWVEGPTSPCRDNRPADQLAPGQAEDQPSQAGSPSGQARGPVQGSLSPGTNACQLAPGQVGGRPKVKPLAPGTFAVQFTMSQGVHDNLRYAQALLGHGDIAEVIELALETLVPELEKRRFAATSRPRAGRGGSSSDPRHIPAQVKRAVWERDGGRCTFVSQAGCRCPARSRLEFDHAEPVARGGEATAANLRLLCRAHNQYEAERTFGSDFMRDKRAAARDKAAARSRVAG